MEACTSHSARVAVTLTSKVLDTQGENWKKNRQGAWALLVPQDMSSLS